MKSIVKGLLYVVLLVAPLGLWAQVTTSPGRVSGVIQDQSDRSAVVGAVVELRAADKPEAEKHYTTSTLGGKFTLPAVAYGTYVLKVTFLGYKPLERNVRVNKESVLVGTLSMQEQSQRIDRVEVAATSMRTSSKGDTLIYNANAFKVTKDANTEELLEKMPGVKVEGGQVEAQGEQVKKILVDGKEFFGSDVTSAIKNLPAEAIDKVEVFNKLSDQSEFSGVDDGEGYKAINIITRPNMNQGTFGKLQATYGFDDKYLVGANVNVFNTKRRFSLIGLSNNVNQMNFSTDDVLGVMGGSSSGGGQRRRGESGTSNSMISSAGGISKLSSIGGNYTEQWNEKVKFEGSYFYNRSDNDLSAYTDRSYFLGVDSTQYYESLGLRNTINNNHRFDGRLEYQINEKNRLMFRPRVSIQNNTAKSVDTSGTFLSTTLMERALINLFQSTSDVVSSGYNLSNSVIYMRKLGNKAGRMLTTDLSGTLTKNDSDQDLYSLTRYYNPLSESIQDQYVSSLSSGYRVSGNITYSEPIAPKMQLLATYRADYNQSDRDKRTYLLPDQTFDEELSNTYNSGYFTQRVGPGFRYSDDRANLIVNAYYQHASLSGDQSFPRQSRTSQRFDNVLYSAMWNMKFTPTRTLRTMLRSSTNNPSVSQLQDVLDVSNPLFVSQGNPALRPVYAHQFYANFVTSDLKRGRTFITSLGGTMQDNYIANALEIADRNGYEIRDAQGNVLTVLNRGAQFSRPVNLNGYWNVNAMMSYGAPLKFVSSNLNLNLRAAYSALPGVINGQTNTTNTLSYTGGATLGSNISEKLDFTLAYNIGYNIASNATRPQANNEYFNQLATGRLKWVTWGGITLQTNASYSKYTGVTDAFSQEYFIWNASLGKKLFSKQQAEISVGVNDLLNQNKSFVRNVTSSYIENVTSNVIGRYVSINFVYNLRYFGGKQAKQMPTGKANSPDSIRPHGMGGMHGH